MRIYRRHEWKSRVLVPRVNQDPRYVGRIFIHWTESGSSRLNRLSRQSAHMREIQNYHMNTHGWSDIGYHFVIFQPYGFLRNARIFEGRSVKAIPAAQQNHNTETIAIAVVMKEGDTLKLATKLKIRLLVRHLRSDVIRHMVPVYVHSDVNDTSCPGPKLRSWVHKTFRMR